MPRPVDPEIAELERQMAEMTGGDPLAPTPEPEPAPVESVEPEAPPEEAAAPAEPEPVAVDTEPEQDWRALAEQRAKDLEDSRKHAARMAGEIGYLKARGAAPAGDGTAEPAVDEDYQRPPTREEFETLRLQHEEARERLAAVENGTDAKLREQADARAVAKARELFVGVDPDVYQTVMGAHKDELAQIDQERDPVRREERATGFLYRAANEANIFQQERNREQMAAKREAASADLARAKRAQTPSGSGGVPPQAPKPRAVADMTAQEVDRWLRENVR